MKEQENFLARWSRRKLEIEENAGAAGAPAETAADKAAPQLDCDAKPIAEDGGEVRHQDTPSHGATTDTPAFDIRSLPTIESITASTDIRAFLAPGVPADLTRAALRRAWVADPNIRDFIGLAENQWDFNNPASIPGFGPLELTDGVRRIVAEVIGDGPRAAGPAPEAVARESDATADDGTPGPQNHDESRRVSEPDAGTDAETGPAPEQPQSNFADNAGDVVHHGKNHIAMRDEEMAEKSASLAARGHGGALPQ
jgi:hypothetical protein